MVLGKGAVSYERGTPVRGEASAERFWPATGLVKSSLMQSYSHNVFINVFKKVNPPSKPSTKHSN